MIARRYKTIDYDINVIKKNTIYLSHSILKEWLDTRYYFLLVFKKYFSCSNVFIQAGTDSPRSQTFKYIFCTWWCNQNRRFWSSDRNCLRQWRLWRLLTKWRVILKCVWPFLTVVTIRHIDKRKPVIHCNLSFLTLSKFFNSPLTNRISRGFVF